MRKYFQFHTLMRKIKSDTHGIFVFVICSLFVFASWTIIKEDISCMNLAYGTLWDWATTSVLFLWNRYWPQNNLKSHRSIFHDSESLLSFLVQAFVLIIANTDFHSSLSLSSTLISFHPLRRYSGSWFFVGPQIKKNNYESHSDCFGNFGPFWVDSWSFGQLWHVLC